MADVSENKKTVPRRSPYNDFMKEELKRLKISNPEMEHKQLFKLAAINWKVSKPKQ